MAGGSFGTRSQVSAAQEQLKTTSKLRKKWKSQKGYMPGAPASVPNYGGGGNVPNYQGVADAVVTGIGALRGGGGGGGSAASGGGSSAVSGGENLWSRANSLGVDFAKELEIFGNSGVGSSIKKFTFL
jgi:hypothetical protein